MTTRAPPTVSIRDHQLPNETHNLYDVTFYSHQIHTLLTYSNSMVNQWLSQIHRNFLSNPLHPKPIVVGLDVEWRPNFSRHIVNPVAIIQLCVGPSCLIFQVAHSPSIPRSLVEFLQSSNCVFVGVGIKSDVEKLVEDYDLSVKNVVDLRGLAAEKMGERQLKNAGLKELTKRVLGLEVNKPKSVTMSRWDNPWLTPSQVQYACVDAFLSFEIGKQLNAAVSAS